MDEIAKIVSAKLTQRQKRGAEAGHGSAHEFHNDRRVVEGTKQRTVEELKRARLSLAELALDQPDPEGWLRDVLEVMDLVHIPDTDPEDVGCGDLAGTKRGYEQHLRSYTRPCNMCDEVRRAQEAARLEQLGIRVEGAGPWSIRIS